MLTKTRKWLFVFVLAIVAVFLAACNGEKPVDEPKVNPADLEIIATTFVGENGTIVGGEQMQLIVTSTTENADLSVNWTSSDEQVAIVTANGKVTGRKGGEVTITATSKKVDTVKATIKVKVYDSAEHITSDIKVLVDEVDKIKLAMPEFIDKTMDLPAVSNDLITVKYKDGDGKLFANNKYVYANYVNDRYESINVELSYKQEKLAFDYQLRIVKDVKDNDFNAVAEAQAFVDKFLKDYKDGMKILGNVGFPSSLVQLKDAYNEVHTSRDVAITWKSINPTVLTDDGEFLYPNDDTLFTVETYFVSNDISAVVRNNLVAKGYTQVEAVNKMLSVVPRQIRAQNVMLPTYDTKFGATIEWTSDKPAVLSAVGKTDPFLKEETVVTLTAKVTYPGTVNESFAFETEAKVEVIVRPATHVAQSVALDLSNQYEESLVKHFPFGERDRDGGNVMPLPKTVGGEGEHKDGVVTWTAAEAGLIDANYTLLKQYLRYHPVKFTYKVTIGGNSATGEVVINVGIAQKANTIYAGGNMYGRVANQAQPYDALHQMSAIDEVSGISNSALFVNGYSGITFYTDVTNETTGVVTRYQFFASNLYSITLNDVEALTIENGVVVDGAVRGSGTKANNNRQYTIVNDTDQPLGVPLHTANTDYLAKTTLLTKDLGGQANAQDNMNISGPHNGFVVDGNGKVIMGFGGTSMEAGIMAANPEAATLPNHIVIPAGGFAYTRRFASPIALATIFANVGQDVFLELYEVPAAPEA